MKSITDFLRGVWETIAGMSDLFTKTLFTLGKSEFSLATMLYILLAFFLLFYLSKKLKKLLIKSLLTKSNVDAGLQESMASITRMVIILIGSMVIIQSAGIDLSALSLLAGALGVGIGFGLQNITNNMISGIIILFENPIKIGDRIEVGSITGDVVNISVRATTIITNDNISVIVPNSEFISNTVTNWSHNDRNIRFHYPVGVGYNEDPEKVKEILLQVAEENEHVLSKPEPKVIFDEFGDSSLNFDLAVWTTSHTDRPQILKSELYYAIFKKFKENNIEIPFPQRDVHIKSKVD